MKLVEALQAENKAFKKKYQTFSVELTKCAKILEVYKVQLTQYENMYN